MLVADYVIFAAVDWPFHIMIEIASINLVGILSFMIEYPGFIQKLLRQPGSDTDYPNTRKAARQPIPALKLQWPSRRL
ncbi:uncharacterized protein PADG_01614 [Paracoccidioides brasiliensis Pb18]|uniref:Uncharacterized protein n=1 Tax=Paracoccidioides brasiliensis (strain Pb18) TaxID=502780 RepID=C1G3U8_PARBD|nr:uncharacterized protein PADG_01614 [Paracoccidioides brasiliensis Pb18]EEH45464.2 hypothetical protein PADG_01614 [Paracoccidioides brasiliensis Pb18]